MMLNNTGSEFLVQVSLWLRNNNCWIKHQSLSQSFFSCLDVLLFIPSYLRWKHESKKNLQLFQQQEQSISLSLILTSTTTYAKHR